MTTLYHIIFVMLFMMLTDGTGREAKPVIQSNSNEKVSWIKKSIELQNGIRLEYVEQGDPNGTAIIFLHGWTDSWNSFERVLPLLPDSYHVFAPSLRGHGNSDKPSDGYKPENFAEDVAAFMDAVNVDSAIFVGFSMGGVISKRFAIDHANRVNGLVLIGTPVNLVGKPEIDELWNLLLTLEDPIDPQFIRSFNESVPVKPVPSEFMERINQANMKVPAHVWRAAFKGVWEADMMDELSAVRVPALILWGDHDSFSTLQDQQELSAAIRGSKIKVYRGNGHAIHWEEPVLFTDDLNNFIKRINTLHDVQKSLK